MAAKLDRKNWAQAVRNRRSKGESRSFTAQIDQRKASPEKSLSGMEWTKRIQQVKKDGGRYHAKLPVGKSRGRQKQIGGFLRSNSAKSRKTLTEEQRQALPKTGDKVPKKGINASNWAYDHRKAMAKRRGPVAARSSAEGKKGINAGKWHYDHRKAMATAKKKNGKMGRPNTHISAEKKRTQQQAIAKNTPQQPKQPTQPKAKIPQKTVAPTKTK